MKTFVAVMNIPSPYRLHLLGVLWRQLQARGIGFHCHFMARGHKERPKSWLNPKIEFPHTYWRDFGVGQCHFNPGLIWSLGWHQPDYMIIGSSYDTLTGTAIAALNHKSVMCVWAEGNTKTPGQLYGFKGWFKRLVYSWFDFALVPGGEAVKYIALHQSLTRRKMPQPDVLPNIIDESKFIPKGEPRVFGAKRICLIPARFDPVKGLKEFFMALASDMLDGWEIIILGHGPEEAVTMQIIKDRGLERFVKVVHSVPYDEMPRYYVQADLMLLPSIRDMNPLCVVEALHAGLPIALSCMAGNVEEAVTEGRNGWVLPVLDPVMYPQKLREVFSASAVQLAEMGRWSKEHNSQFWNSERAVRRFLDVMLGKSEK